jgi:hypothetical protein
VNQAKGGRAAAKRTSLTDTPGPGQWRAYAVQLPCKNINPTTNPAAAAAKPSQGTHRC